MEWFVGFENQFVCVYENQICNYIGNCWCYNLVINNFVNFVLFNCVYIYVYSCEVNDGINNRVSSRNWLVQV